MESLESTVVKEEFPEEIDSVNSDDDIQFVRVKREPCGDNSTGPLFEIVPKVENVDVVIESSSEENDDSNDEDWEYEDVPKFNNVEGKRKTAAGPKNPRKRPSRKLSPSSAEDGTGSGSEIELNEPEGGAKLKKSRKKRTGKGGKEPYRWERKIKECEICGVKVKTLKRHMATHTDTRPHKCPDCPKTFRRKWNLTNHQRTHTGEKPFKCDICHIAYQRKAHLEKHVLEEHVVDKEFPCKQCEKAFINQQQLTDHIKVFHHRINYYRHTCHLCSRPYREIQEYKNHLKRVHSRLSYCKLCKNSFYSEEENEGHLVERKDAFKCAECDKPFPTLCLFRQHSETHPDSGYVEEIDEKDLSYRGRAFPRRTSAKVRQKNISKRKSLLLNSQKLTADTLDTPEKPDEDENTSDD